MARQLYKHVRIYNDYTGGTPMYIVRLIAIETLAFPHGIRLGMPTADRQHAERFASAADDYINTMLASKS